MTRQPHLRLKILVIVDISARDVTKIGHFGTGNLEVTIGSTDDFERAQPWIQMSLLSELAVLRASCQFRAFPSMLSRPWTRARAGR